MIYTILTTIQGCFQAKLNLNLAKLNLSFGIETFPIEIVDLHDLSYELVQIPPQNLHSLITFYVFLVGE